MWEVPFGSVTSKPPAVGGGTATKRLEAEGVSNRRDLINRVRRERRVNNQRGVHRPPTKQGSWNA
jgi:hypothetical protein